MFLHHLFERGRSTVQDQSVICRRRHVRLKHVFGDEANALSPAFLLVRLDVDGEEHVEVVHVLLLEAKEFVLEQDIVGCAVSENQGTLCAVTI
jgi:hypothetical protein